MKSLLASICCVVVAAIWLAGQGQKVNRPNTLTPEEAKDGWTLLFDGVSLKGWQDLRLKTPQGDAWSIEDGWLKATSHPHIVEDLFTTATFRDFDLSWDWIIAPAGNSGLKYRIQDHLFVQPVDLAHPQERFEARVERSFVDRVKGRPQSGQDYVIGFEYQMTDDPTNSDSKGNEKHTAGALYDMVAPSSHPTRPAGKVNHSRILLRGEHVEHWLNEVKVVDSSLDSPAAMAGIQKRWASAPHVLELLAKQPRKDCPISLQNHTDEAWFRSIKIKRLN